MCAKEQTYAHELYYTYTVIRRMPIQISDANGIAKAIRKDKHTTHVQAGALWQLDRGHNQSVLVVHDT